MVLVRFFLLLLLFSSCSFAGGEKKEGYSGDYNDCLDKVIPINNNIVYSCSEFVSQEARKEINYLYGRIYAQLLKDAPEDAAKLEQAQKSWLSYRRLHCELAGVHIGSPMSSVCLMNMNIQRAQELRMLSGE